MMPSPHSGAADGSGAAEAAMGGEPLLQELRMLLGNPEAALKALHEALKEPGPTAEPPATPAVAALSEAA